MPHTPVQPLIAIAGAGVFPVASISSTVLDGSLWLSIPLAALAGFISFASPCVLPLVPGYLGYVAGLTGANIPATGASQADGHAAEPVDAKTFALVNPAAARHVAPMAPQTQDVVDNHSASAPITAESKAQTPNEYAVTRRKATWRLLAGVALFIAGFSAIFVLLSVVLAQLGTAPWLKGQSWVTMILGALVVLMGVVFLGGLSIFQTDKRLHRRPITGLWGAPILGITFGLGWAPRSDSRILSGPGRSFSARGMGHGQGSEHPGVGAKTSPGHTAGGRCRTHPDRGTAHDGAVDRADVMDTGGITRLRTTDLRKEGCHGFRTQRR